ncbi:hypothetical protein GCM10010398_74570 [Streptomyces fimbriatus]
MRGTLAASPTSMLVGKRDAAPLPIGHTRAARVCGLAAPTTAGPLSVRVDRPGRVALRLVTAGPRGPRDRSGTAIR